MDHSKPNNATMSHFIVPDWPTPTNVRALSTTRHGGISLPPYDSLNLGDHVGDKPDHVAANRARLLATAALPAAPRWLQQVHGTRCVDVATVSDNEAADAGISHTADVVCAVMTADCLPLLFCDRAGTRVAAAHAGWRGLLGGVIESTLTALACPGDQLLAWLGPAIGPTAFEVGSEVRDAFLAEDARQAHAFRPSAQAGKWLCDLYALARHRLLRAGVTAIYGGDRCTLTEADTFFSYRRDGTTGRMASLIWLAATENR